MMQPTHGYVDTLPQWRSPRDGNDRTRSAAQIGLRSYVALATMVCLSCSAVALAGSVPPVGHRLAVLVVPGLSARDLTRPEAPALRRLLSRGAGGWIVSRAARAANGAGRTEGSLLLTLGSGARAVAGAELTHLALLQNGPSMAITRELLVNELRRDNAALDHAVPIGAAGDLVHRAGRGTAFIGNADTASQNRDAFGIAMDRDGLVDFAGPARSAGAPDPAAPYGVRADVPAMLRDYDALPQRVALCVLEFGDLDRTNRYAALCYPAVAAKLRTAALGYLDSLLTGLAERQRATHGLILCVLAAGPANYSPADTLSPFIIAGDGIQPGLAQSPSTRWPGVIVSTDFGATAASLLGLTGYTRETGRRIRSDGRGSVSALRLQQIHSALVDTARQQDAYGGLPSVQLVLILAGIGTVYLARCKPAARVIALVSATLPLAMLLLPALRLHGLVWPAVEIATAGCVVAAAGARSMRSAELSLAFACYALIGASVMDLLSGYHLMRQAWMGYSVMEGARYYGIGNEYMGAVIGAGVVLTAIASARVKGAWPWPAFLAVVGVVMTWFGAKAGAAPSAAGAWSVCIMAARGAAVRARAIAAWIGVALVSLAGVAALDALRPSRLQTHLARAMAGGAITTLPAVVRRKVLLEAYLLGHSPWSATLGVSAAAIWLISRRASDGDAGRRTRQLRTLLIGGCAGAISCLLFNDSGVTAATLVLVYAFDAALLNATAA